jgi:hypothetical protein
VCVAILTRPVYANEHWAWYGKFQCTDDTKILSP